jgi:hypothetical protein
MAAKGAEDWVVSKSRLLKGAPGAGRARGRGWWSMTGEVYEGWRLSSELVT